MNDLEKRLTDLEINFSLQEEFINELNQIIIKQKDQITQITDCLKSLKEPPGQAGEDELPPHY